MKRAVQLGAIIFDDNGMFIQEEMNDNDVSGEVVMSAAGSHISYASEIVTPYITLDSKQHGWITDSQRIELISMRKQVGATFTLTYDDTTTDEVRFAHEKNMTFSELSEGACEFIGIIPLAKT